VSSALIGVANAPHGLASGCRMCFVKCFMALRYWLDKCRGHGQAFNRITCKALKAFRILFGSCLFVGREFE
jgi:hypothetical protein